MEEKIFDQAFFDGLTRIKLVSKLNLQNGGVGMRKSSAKGSSVEFADFREYMLGDDIRRIDWNAYGRMDRLFVKLFREEREAFYTIVIDNSKSMGFGSPLKGHKAVRVAGALSYMILNNQDRVCTVSRSGGKVMRSKAVSGKSGFQRILTQLEQITYEGETDLLGMVKQIPFSGKGVTVLISDFFDQGSNVEYMERMKETIRFLAYQKQEVILIQVLDREEVEPTLEGTLRLVDSETKEELQVTAGKRLMDCYKKVLKKYQEQIAQVAKGYQASLMVVKNDDPIDKFIFDGIKTGQLEQI